jgi:hypothetical protein
MREDSGVQTSPRKNKCSEPSASFEIVPCSFSSWLFFISETPTSRLLLQDIRLPLDNILRRRHSPGSIIRSRIYDSCLSVWVRNYDATKTHDPRKTHYNAAATSSRSSLVDLPRFASSFAIVCHIAPRWDSAATQRVTSSASGAIPCCRSNLIHLAYASPISGPRPRRQYG